MKKLNHIVIIDDDEGFVELLKRQLTTAEVLDYQADEITKLSSLKDFFNDERCLDADLILLDLNLPDSQGLETLANVLSYTRKNVPVVVISGAEDDTVRKAVHLGAELFIQKDHINNSTKLVRSLLWQTVQKHVTLNDFLSKYSGE